MTAYVVSNQYTLTFTFRDAAGNLADPTTVVVSIQDPLGVVTTPAVTRVSLGVYTVQWVPNARNEWRVTAEGSGALVAHAPDERLYVDGSFAP